MGKPMSRRAFAARHLSLIGVLGALAACAVVPPASPPPAPPPPPPAPPPPPPPRPVAAAPERPWDVALLTTGDWTYKREPSGPVATFGPPNSEGTLEVRCRAATREIAVSRLGSSGQRGMMTIRTSAGDLSWPAAPSPDGLETTIAVRPASDRGFDWIGFSRGRFSVEVTGLPRLVVPAWAEISRVVEDCRG